MPLHRRLLRTMLWCLALAAAAGMFTILVRDRDFTWRLAVTGLLAGVASGLSIPVAKLMDREPTRRGGVAGLLMVVVGFLLGLAATWVRSEEHTSELQSL